MARTKKVVTAPIEKKEPDAPTFSDAEIDAGLEITHKEYFMQVVGLLSHKPSIKELNYIKVPLMTPDGGTYLVSILHVDGPKIQLNALAKAADAMVAEQGKKPNE